MSVDFYQVINSANEQGSDVQYNVFGSILTVDGTDKTEQRIMRRLITSPGTYYWHPSYGVGIPSHIGDNLTTPLINKLRSECVSQILKEKTVAKIPVPTVNIEQTALYQLTITVAYTDAITGESNIITFDVTKQ